MAITITSHISANSVAGKDQTRIKKGQIIPDFVVEDVYGNKISISDFRGKKVLLTFYRNVGCPVCNFRFHELQEQTTYFKKNIVILLSVYESSTLKMKEYINGETFTSIMIPDPEEQLYSLFAIDKSYGKMMKAMFNGMMGKVKKGKKMFKNKTKQDGNVNRIGADFLIDEDGKVLISHYHNYLGDDLALDQLKKGIESK